MELLELGKITRRHMMKMLKYIGALAVSLSAATAQAVPLSGLLQGDTLEIGDKVFADWELIYQENPFIADMDLSLIDVSTVGDGSGADPYGLRFSGNGQWSLNSDVLDFDFLDLWFGYSVTVTDPGKAISEVTLSSEGGVAGNASYTAVKWISDANLDLIDVIDVYDDTLLGQSLSASVNVGSQQKLWIEDNLFAGYDSCVDFPDCTQLLDSSVSLRAFEQRFVQIDTTDVPVPATLALMVVGLAGFSVRRLRKI